MSATGGNQMRMERDYSRGEDRWVQNSCLSRWNCKLPLRENGKVAHERRKFSVLRMRHICLEMDPIQAFHRLEYI